MTYYLGGISGPGQVAFMAAVAPVTITVNTSVALLIAARLVYAHRLLSLPLSMEKNTKPGPYLTALAICIESSALIIAAAVASVVCLDVIAIVPQISMS